MNKNVTTRLAMTVGLALGSPAVFAVDPTIPTDFDTYTKQIWVEENLEGDDGDNQTGIIQSEVTADGKGLVDIYQNGSGNTAGTDAARLIQSGDGTKILRIGQGATLSTDEARVWASRWSTTEPSVSGNTVKASQSGNANHTASIYQLSDGNTAEIIQAGNVDLNTTITQGGGGNIQTKVDQSVIDGGFAHSVDIYQAGGKLAITQRGSAQTVNIGEDGAGKDVLFTSDGMTIDQQAGENNTVIMKAAGTNSAGLGGSIVQNGIGLKTTITTNGLSTKDGLASIDQAGIRNEISATFKSGGGTINIKQVGGGAADGDKNLITASVGGNSTMTLDQAGTSNVIDADINDESILSVVDDNAAGQAGSNNRIVVRGSASTITAKQANAEGSNNKIHLGATVDDEGRTTAADYVVAENPGLITSSTINVTQTHSNNLLNVASSNHANLTITQNGGARADLGSVSSTVNITQ